MVNRKELVKEFKKKIEVLRKHNKLYFNQDNPKISDSNYDILKKELVNLEKKNKFLKDLNLLDNIGTNAVGFSFFIGFSTTLKIQSIHMMIFFHE